MLHDAQDDGTTQSTEYEPPRISEIGSLQELTLAMNKNGRSSDTFSNLVPLVGSILNPAR